MWVFSLRYYSEEHRVGRVRIAVIYSGVAISQGDWDRVNHRGNAQGVELNLASLRCGAQYECLENPCRS